MKACFTGLGYIGLPSAIVAADNGIEVTGVDTFIEALEKRQELKVSCLEEIAWRKGWLSDEQRLKIAEPMHKNGYRQYLQKLVD